MHGSSGEPNEHMHTVEVLGCAALYTKQVRNIRIVLEWVDKSADIFFEMIDHPSQAPSGKYGVMLFLINKELMIVTS